MQPVVLSDVDAAFPADVKALMPPWEDIPNSFKQWTGPWINLAERWFYQGLDIALVPKEGIDLTTAVRHLSAVMRSRQSKHEHKIAAVAYLMSQWFEEKNVP